MGLPGSEDRLTIDPFWHNIMWRTDRQTDRRTDVQPISIGLTCAVWLTHVNNALIDLVALTIDLKTTKQTMSLLGYPKVIDSHTKFEHFGIIRFDWIWLDYFPYKVTNRQTELRNKQTVPNVIVLPKPTDRVSVEDEDEDDLETHKETSKNWTETTLLQRKSR